MTKKSSSGPRKAAQKTAVSPLDWPANSVELRPLKDLVAFANNARTHSAEQVAELAASMVEFGFTNPVLVDEADQIIAGHGRVMAAESLGLAQVPVMVARGWSEAKRRAYVLADNQLALNSGWDLDKLKVELTDLQAQDYDLGVLGFSDGELAAALKGWEPDFQLHERTADDAGALLATIKIKCPQGQADAVREAIQAALAGFPDAALA